MPPPNRQKERKAKTKTFVGCWTCRSRKVKCDSVRPQCRRCIQAGLQCQGYDIRLHWLHHDDPAPPPPWAIKRQAMNVLSENPQWARSTGEIDGYMADIESRGVELGAETFCAGPFAVFPASDDSGPSGHRPGSLGDFVSRDMSEGLTDLARGRTTDDLSTTDAEALGWVEVDSVPTLDTASWPGQPQSQPSPSNDDRQACLDGTNSRLAMSAGRNSLVGTLIHHYVHIVANLLQPVVHPRNTYTSIYVPSAMTALSNFSWDESPGQGSSRTSPSELALFFSLLASSAFHLRGYRDTSSGDAIARYCRTKAISNLQVSLAGISASDEQPGPGGQVASAANLEAVLSVVMTLVTADVMDGSMSEFWIHLQAAKQISQRLAGKVKADSRAGRLVNISRFLRIISDTTDWSLGAIPWRPDASGDDNDGQDMISGVGHGLEFTYGITATLASLICRITRLARHMSFYSLPSNPPAPAGLLSACEGLLEELSAWEIAQERLPSFADSDDVTILIATKHILAFAQSIRIYYHTKIVPWAAPSKMASCIRTVARHLSEIESIKEDTGYNAVLTATVAWPGFIASCEAEPEEREVWREWWARMLKYGIGNISNLWSVVNDAWSLRDSGTNETPAWAPILRRSGKKILAI